MKKYLYICMIMIILLASMLSGCLSNKKLFIFYSDRDNYVSSDGVVTFINYTDDILYLAFSDMTYQFDDDSFEIVGANYEIILERGGKKKIEVGDKVTFVAAPQYFGDGYVMPIVGLTVDGEEILSFDEGYNNLLKWYRGES